MDDLLDVIILPPDSEGENPFGLALRIIRSGLITVRNGNVAVSQGTKMPRSTASTPRPIGKPLQIIRPPLK